MDTLTPIYCFLDESGTHDSAKIMCMSLVVTENPDAIRRKCRELLERIKNHPQYGAYIKSIAANGIDWFHHNADIDDIRNIFVDALRAMDIDAYIAFVRKDEIDPALSEIDIKLSMYERLISHIASGNHYRDIFVVVERFHEGSSTTERKFITKAAEIHNRIPRQQKVTKMGTISIEFENKEELCLGTADYICSLFSAYAHQILENRTAAEYSLKRRQYEAVSGKIRRIHDITRDRSFSRQAEEFSIDAFLR
jgi:hypothetical protein